MSRTAYPTETDLSQFLLASGLLTAPPSAQADLLDLAGAVAAAAHDWEVTTGYQPFLANASAVLRKFDPPGAPIRGTRYGYRARGGERVLVLDNGLTALTSVTTGVDANSTGTVRTLGTDFYLYPENAAARGQAWQKIEFVTPVYGSQQSVQILGKWGYSATVPDDAWTAIMAGAACLLAPQLALLISGGMYSVREYSTEIRYAGAGTTPLTNETAAWKKIYTDGVNRYLREW